GESSDQGRRQGQAAALRGRQHQRAQCGVRMRLWAWGQSDPGRKRERNEDSYLVDPQTGVLAVADGMGGRQGGATASRMAGELRGGELAEAQGDYQGALERQRELSVRTTEELVALQGETTTDIEAPQPAPTERMPVLSPSSVVFSPPLELMRTIVRRASS